MVNDETFLVFKNIRHEKLEKIQRKQIPAETEMRERKPRMFLKEQKKAIFSCIYLKFEFFVKIDFFEEVLMEMTV